LLKSSKTDANVLILGENGTGKFVFAEHIHQHSDRKDKPFVHIDLGSLSENLFESETMPKVLYRCQNRYTRTI
jgi:transcriptional regulator with PAS, ATPase and Fis domain